MAQVDQRLRKTRSGFDPEKVRKRLLVERPFSAERVQRFQVRPLDMRYAYVETKTPIWNRSRPLLVAAAKEAAGFLLVRRRAPRALDGATFHYSDCLVDQKVLFTDAYAIPFWLSGRGAETEEPATPLFEASADGEADAWRANLSGAALTYLRSLGVTDALTDRGSASLIWLHALAIGFSPLYVEQNGDAVRSNWPRVPMPNSEKALRDSAALGASLAALLDPDTPVLGIDKARITAQMQPISSIERVGAGALDPGTGDLALTAGWGIVQTRAVMPGAGKFDQRDRSDADNVGLTDEQRDLLGEQVLDIYLNDNARWRNVPAAAWDYKIGGFQVLRKWLSYRDKRVLGRDLTTAEARTFTNITRRLSSLVLLGPKLDANYVGVTDSPLQERLFAGE